MDATSPIFIIGTERSGTNLLRLILTTHSAIAIPHPPHVMKLFAPLLPSYGDLSDDRNFRRLVRDVARMVELHPYPWEVRPDRERIFRRARDRSLVSVFFELYEQVREHTGKRRFGCKSTFMLEHVAEILRHTPTAQFIHLVRDARDVALSAKTSIFSDFHVYDTARRWQREQALALEWAARLPATQLLRLRYEDLLADPAAATRTVCDFLGEAFEPAMLAYHRTAEARKSGRLSISWKNTRRPVLRDNAQRYRRGLSTAEVALVEAIAFRELEAFGYPLTTGPAEVQAARRAAALRPRLRYRLTAALLHLRAEVEHLLRDRSSVARKRKELYMAWLRATRRWAGRHG